MSVTRDSQRMKKNGIDVCTLSIGDTHFTTPLKIQESAKNACSAHTHYGNAQGLEELRSLIATHWYDKKVTNEDICLTPGVKQGIYYLLSLLPGKRVCVLEPAWLGYQAITQLVGKDFIPINRYKPQWLETLRKTPFDILIICTPNNPDGYIFSSEEQELIFKIASEKNAALIVDEIYGKFQYEKSASSFVTYMDKYPSLFLIDGFSKAYAMTGFRLGFIATKNSELLSQCVTMQEHIATCPSTIAQYAAIRFPEVQDEVAQFVMQYEENRNLVADVFPEFAAQKPDGGFYYFVDLQPFGIEQSLAFSHKLLNEFHVAVVPGDAYGEPFHSWIRISFSIDPVELTKGLERLRSALQKIVR